MAGDGSGEMRVIVRPEPVLCRHADHDPALICRPALGNGLCEVLGDEERSGEETT